MIKDFAHYLKKTGEYAEVSQIQMPLVRAVGLPGAHPHELVVFQSGALGEVFSLAEEEILVMTLSRTPIKPRERLTRTGEFLSVRVGKGMLGSIINPFGEIIHAKKKSLFFFIF